MSAARIAPGRCHPNTDAERSNVDGCLEISEPDLRSQVEHKFVEMTEAHDRIRGEFLQSHDQNNGPDLSTNF